MNTITEKVAIRNKGKIIHEGNSGIGVDISLSIGLVRKGTKLILGKLKSYLKS